MTMSMIATTRQREAAADARRDFIQLARYAMLSKGKTLDARAHAEAEGASHRVQRILEKAEPGMVSAPGGSPSTWGSALSDYAQAEQAFVASLRNAGAYDRMAGDIIQVPLRTRLAVSWTASFGFTRLVRYLRPFPGVALIFRWAWRCASEQNRCGRPRFVSGTGSPQCSHRFTKASIAHPLAELRGPR